MHGSVETGALKKAQTINTKGVYVVGYTTDQPPSVENSVRLKLPDKKTSKS